MQTEILNTKAQPDCNGLGYTAVPFFMLFS